MGVAEFGEKVARVLDGYSPEDIFRLSERLYYHPARQEGSWQILTRPNKFVAIHVYKFFFIDRAYPVSGEFKSLDEVVGSLEEIERHILGSPFDFRTTAYLSAWLTGMAETFAIKILEKYTRIFSEQRCPIIPSFIVAIALPPLAFYLGGVIGKKAENKRFSQLPESAKNYLLGYEAYKDLSLKAGHG